MFHQTIGRVIAMVRFKVMDEKDYYGIRAFEINVNTIHIHTGYIKVPQCKWDWHTKRKQGEEIIKTN